mmetsp:Transcript_12043/g.21798  ORF Transcript_12043/g.21798 Transcript_12043/m.21798 type:complete len:216 (-) Transcript_12043:40-687(-)
MGHRNLKVLVPKLHEDDRFSFVEDDEDLVVTTVPLRSETVPIRINKTPRTPKSPTSEAASPPSTGRFSVRRSLSRRAAGNGTRRGRTIENTRLAAMDYGRSVAPSPRSRTEVDERKGDQSRTPERRPRRRSRSRGPVRRGRRIGTVNRRLQRSQAISPPQRALVPPISALESIVDSLQLGESYSLEELENIHSTLDATKRVSFAGLSAAFVQLTS